VHGSHLEHRFEQFPKAFDLMVLLPDVPHLGAPHGLLAKTHQVITPSRAFLEEQSDINLIALKLIFELSEHGDQLTRFIRMATTLFGTKEEVDG
jgi:hypothetical protein